MKKRRFKKRYFLSLVLIGFAALWFWGLQQFIAAIPVVPVQDSEKTDVIVVLTGGEDRLRTGAELLLQKKADYLFITGIGAKSDEVLSAIAWPQGYDYTKHVELGGRAEDTFGNAQETALWIQGKKMTSLRLVTGSYHMPRSLLEFRQAMPGKKIIPHPVFPQQFQLERFWRSRGSAWLVVGEYHKYMLAWIGHRFIEVFFE